MTCQNCGHPKNRHQWVLDRRDICSEKGCDCNGYKKAHPVPAVTDLPDAEAAAEEQDTECESLTDHDREVLWQTLGRCFSVAPNSPESCAMVDAMVEQIITSHVRASAADPRETEN